MFSKENHNCIKQFVFPEQQLKFTHIRFWCQESREGSVETLLSGKRAVKNREDVYLEEYQYIQPAELGGLRLPYTLPDMVCLH